MTRWRVLGGYPCLGHAGGQETPNKRVPDIYIKPGPLGTRH